MMEEDRCGLIWEKKAAVTQKLCDYINVEAEPALTQPAHCEPSKKMTMIARQRQGKGGGNNVQ